jgi:hypothetical protein
MIIHAVRFRRTQGGESENGITINEGQVIIDLEGDVIEQLWSWELLDHILAIPVIEAYFPDQRKIMEGKGA